MSRSPRLAAGALALIAMTVAGTLFAQAQQVYRYTDVDGRIVYSDRPPPANAKDVQPKRLGANFIETTQMPLAAQQAMDRYPVTLFTFDCGEVCQNAEGLLNRRGVPFSIVNVQEPAGAARLKSLTGEQGAPVLQVGDKLIGKGYSEPQWQAMLDEAGYPKTPPSRRAPAGRTEPARPEAAPASAPAVAAAPPKGTYPQ